MDPAVKKGATRRDFLYLTAGAMGAVGAGCAAWPLIDSMNPAADTLAAGSTEVDISKVEVGSALTAVWRGSPLFIRHRTPAEIKSVRDMDWKSLRDPQPDEARTLKAEWIIIKGVCTHLGCIPLGQKPGDPRGEFNGWFCPCHGSQYDVSGRIRKGPAPLNMFVPPYKFVSDTVVHVGSCHDFPNPGF